MTKKAAAQEKMTLKQQRGILADRMNFAASEAYKLLRTNLMFALPDQNECRVIGVTSALRGEGKSTTAINLSYTIAETEKRVLLVEADMRLPNVARRLGLRKAPGLSNLLAGLASEEEVIQRSGILDSFHILTSGDIPPNPAELLGSEHMMTVTKKLGKHFDFIIFDLPPVNAVSDGLIVSKLVQGMLVVVRQDFGDRRALNDAVRRLKYLDAKILGFVMTYGQTEKRGYGKHRYGNGQYDYNYGYGARSQKRKPAAAKKGPVQVSGQKRHG